MKQVITLTVNNQIHGLEIEVNKTLLEVIREDLGLTGAKYGCGNGECGACTVLVDGKPVPSCLTLAVSVDKKRIITIEGLAEGDKLHPLQEAFVQYGAVECGFCTPGMILTAKALLDENPNPTDEDIRRYLRGNLCRCSGYTKIIEAIAGAVKVLARGGQYA